ncbi:MAG: sensor histidine kinase [Syntrophales bacterium]
MQIKKRLQINVAVSVLTVFVICLVLFLSLHQLNKANDSAKIAGEIITGMLERVTLRNDYTQNNNARAKEQWFAKQKQIKELLKSASKNFPSAEDRKNIAVLIENHESIGRIFSAMVAGREKSGVNPVSADLSHEVEERLVTQLNMRVYEAVVYGRRLLESSRKARASAIRLAGGSIIAALLIIIAVTITNLWTMGRSITERVGRLHYGATVIGNGDLHHRIDIKGDDELAELSEAFNVMTAKLQESHRDLEKEIGERRRVEATLVENAAKMEAINKELESFSYSVSHDLRAPLRAIAGFSQMILKREGDRFDGETRRRFRVITDSIETMGRIIDDLLAFSRLGRREVTRIDLDMEALIQDVWQELVMIHPGRKMSLSIGQMPAAQGDPTLIRQVYGNLLGNAVKFTQGRDAALIEAGSCRKDNETVYYVRDNGIGFDMQYHDKLFGVFQRLQTDEEYEGTGIGLAIVERIVNRHGGRVWAEGKVGEGACFHFTLPRG